MRFSIVRTILLKELRETLRDRRTLLLTVGLPVLLYPLAILAFTRIAESGEDAIAAGRSAVAVWGTLPAPVERVLGAADGLTLLPWAGVADGVRDEILSGRLTRVDASDDDRATTGPRRRAAGTRPGREIEPENAVLAAAREAVASRAVEAVIVAWADAVPAVERGATATITVYYDSVRRESVVAQGRVAEALADARNAVIAERQRTRNLPDGFAQALTLERRNTARADRRSGQMLGALLPYILLTLSVLGGMYAAIDLTAGEKERGTMQTLLVAPIRPVEIVVAKFLAVWLLSMLSLVANLASLSLTVSRLLPADATGVGAGNLLLALVVLVPVTLTTSALFLTIASFARDFRDGQTLLTPMYMAVVLPAAVVAMPTITLNAWTAFVPVVNVTLLIKALFLREASAELVFLTLISASVYAAVAIAAAVHVFHRETVLVGERSSIRTVFERRAGSQTDADPRGRPHGVRGGAGDRVLRQPVAARLADPSGVAAAAVRRVPAADARRGLALRIQRATDTRVVAAIDDGTRPGGRARRHRVALRRRHRVAGAAAAGVADPGAAAAHPARRRPDAAVGGVAGTGAHTRPVRRAVLPRSGLLRDAAAGDVAGGAGDGAALRPRPRVDLPAPADLHPRGPARRGALAVRISRPRRRDARGEQRA